MITVKKAKLNKEKTLSNIAFTEAIDDKAHKDHENVKCDWIAHTDLEMVFLALAPHVAFLCELPEAQGHDLESFRETVNTITVNSFSVSDSGDEEGVTLSATRVLNYGRQMTINTPFLKYSDVYEFMSELGESIEACREEVKLYLAGKAAPKRQLSIFDEMDEEDLQLGEDGIQVSVQEKPEKKKKRVVKVK